MLPSYRKCLRKLMQVNTSIEKQSGGVVFVRTQAFGPVYNEAYEVVTT